MAAYDLYLTLMRTVRGRFEVIDALKAAPGDEFIRGESAAFHGRKIVEAIAFGCLVAIEHGMKSVPRDAKGQWNAETILKNLRAKGLDVFPSPSRIRAATAQESSEQNVKIVIEGIPERRISHTELTQIYQRLHSWLHEVNPYTTASLEDFCRQRAPALWEDLARLHAFVDKHVMSISGAAFFCVLKDDVDHERKVLPLTRPPDCIA